MEKRCYNLSTSGKNAKILTTEGQKNKPNKRKLEREEIEMDRTNKYMQNMIEANEYRDYFAEIVAFVLRLCRSDAFCGVVSTVTFIFSLLFVVGVAGGIEMNLISYTIAIPTLVMLVCVLALVHRVRK